MNPTLKFKITFVTIQKVILLFERSILRNINTNYLSLRVLFKLVFG